MASRVGPADPGAVHPWLRWMAATTIGVVGGMLGLFAVLAPFGDLLEAEAVFLVVFPLALGGVAALVASLQRRVMRHALPLPRAWVWAGAAGLAGGLAVALLLGEGSGLAGKVLEGALHGGVIGLLTGAMQWRFALRDRLAAAWLWIPITVAAWSLGAAAGDTIGYFAGGPLDLLTGMLVAGALTGVAMVALRHRRHP